MMRIPTGLLVALAGLLLLCALPAQEVVGQSQTPVTVEDRAAAEQRFAQGLRFAAAEDWQKAAPIFEELLKQYPTSMEVANNLAVVLFHLGRIDRTQEILAGILEGNEETRTSFRNLQLLYGYLTAEAYRQGMGDPKRSRRPTMLLKQTLFAKTGPPEDGEVAVAPPVVRATASAATVPPSVDPRPVELEGVQQRLMAWAAAWSQGEVDRYLAFYRSDYAPHGKSRLSWLRERRAKVYPARKISVEVVVKEMNPVGGEGDGMQKVRTLFVQRYQAGGYQDLTLKRILWSRQGDTWLIEEEETVPSP